MAGKIQKHDVKTEAELIAAGAAASDLINDTQIWVTGGSINKTLDDAINDGDLSGGGGGGMSDNLISSGDSNFNGGTVGNWLRYNDGAVSSPVDGTGGSLSADFDIAASSSTPLDGAYSLLLTKTNATNFQGYGFSLSDIIVPVEQRGQGLNVGFSYTIVSGAYTTDDMNIFVYDQTNATLLSIATTGLVNTTAGVAARFISFIRPATNTALIRLIVHQSTTSANNYSIKFDNFFITPSYDVLVKATSSTTAVGTGLTTIVFPTVVYDQWGGYNNSTGEFTVPLAGKYEMALNVNPGAAVSSTATNEGVFVYAVKNGAVFARFVPFTYQVTGVSLSPRAGGVSSVDAKKDDVLKFQINRDTNVGSFSLDGSASQTFMTIKRTGI